MGSGLFFFLMDEWRVPWEKRITFWYYEKEFIRLKSSYRPIKKKEWKKWFILIEHFQKVRFHDSIPLMYIRTYITPFISTCNEGKQGDVCVFFYFCLWYQKNSTVEWIPLFRNSNKSSAPTSTPLRRNIHNQYIPVRTYDTLCIKNIGCHWIWRKMELFLAKYLAQD